MSWFRHENDKLTVIDWRWSAAADTHETNWHKCDHLQHINNSNTLHLTKMEGLVIILESYSCTTLTGQNLSFRVLFLKWIKDYHKCIFNVFLYLYVFLTQWNKTGQWWAESKFIGKCIWNWIWCHCKHTMFHKMIKISQNIAKI